MSALGTLARRFSHRRWFARTIRFVVPVDRLIGRLTRGRVVALGIAPSLIITTTGRRSGQPRSNPLLYVRDGDAYVVIGSNWGQTQHPAWSLNLLAEPTATVTLDGHRLPVRATLAQGAQRERLWQVLLAEWPAYRTYVERAGGRDLRIFRLVPDGPAAAVPEPREPRP
ncbi:nitroreductase family deazaflavin-dependent oxidoreductase [Micromonospora sp. NBC_01699]|uniref:nitroreductase family deazaflavin-dependent oxidoreductase n=1 Tax=Micromonospora sp. NBC_01699 TaxID=2975984 RepID=UPI002E335C55|nr:nitroreductase family deazaflavin-dependent oxidoreductase [Micromonospora sp. NBC_01699]